MVCVINHNIICVHNRMLFCRKLKLFTEAVHFETLDSLSGLLPNETEYSHLFDNFDNQI